MAIYDVASPDGKIHSFEGPDGLSQDEVIRTATEQLYTPELERDYSLGEIVSKGFGRGAKRIGSTIGDVLPAMGASALGFDEYAKKQMQEAQASEATIAKTMAPQYPSYKDVKGVGDAGKFVLETAFEQIPNLFGIIGTGGVGGVAGGIAAKTAAKKATEALTKKEFKKQISEQASARAAKKILSDINKSKAKGQAAGVFLGSYALNAPEVFQNIYEQTGDFEPLAASLAGIVNASLDSILPTSIMKSFSKPGRASVVTEILQKSGMQPGLARRATANILGGLGTEGLTEATQEAVSIAAEKFVQGHSVIFDSDDFDRMLEAGIKGAVAGGTFKGVASIPEHLREKALTKKASPEKQEEIIEETKLVDTTVTTPVATTQTATTTTEAVIEPQPSTEARDQEAANVLAQQAKVEQLQKDLDTQLLDEKSITQVMEKDLDTYFGGYNENERKQIRNDLKKLRSEITKAKALGRTAETDAKLANSKQNIANKVNPDEVVITPAMLESAGITADTVDQGLVNYFTERPFSSKELADFGKQAQAMLTKAKTDNNVEAITKFGNLKKALPKLRKEIENARNRTAEYTAGTAGVSNDSIGVPDSIPTESAIPTDGSPVVVDPNVAGTVESGTSGEPRSLTQRINALKARIKIDDPQSDIITELDNIVDEDPAMALNYVEQLEVEFGITPPPQETQESRTDTQLADIESRLAQAEFEVQSYLNQEPNRKIPSYIANRVRALRKEKADYLATQESRVETEGTGQTTETVTAELVQEFGPGVNRMIESGKLVIVNSVDQLPANIKMSSTANGAYAPKTQTSYIVANRIQKGQARRILLHEIGEHYGLERMVGKDYIPLLNRLKTLRKQNAEVQAIFDEVQRLYPELTVDSTPFLQEVMAKLGERAPNNSLFRRIVGAVKNFLRRLGLYDVNKFSDADIQDMILNSLRVSLAEATSTRGQTSSTAAVQMSKKEIKTIAGWLPERITKLIEELNNNNTASNYAKQGTYYVATMSPQQFLDLASQKLIGTEAESIKSLDAQIAEYFEGNSEAVVKWVNQFDKDGAYMGNPYDVPNLTFESPERGWAKITGHEGRHRARALQRLGVTQMPVLMIGPRREIAPDNTDTRFPKRVAVPNIAGKKFVKQEARFEFEENTVIDNIISIEPENEAAIREMIDFNVNPEVSQDIQFSKEEVTDTIMELKSKIQPAKPREAAAKVQGEALNIRLPKNTNPIKDENKKGVLEKDEEIPEVVPAKELTAEEKAASDINIVDLGGVPSKSFAMKQFDKLGNSILNMPVVQSGTGRELVSFLSTLKDKAARIYMGFLSIPNKIELFGDQISGLRELQSFLELKANIIKQGREQVSVVLRYAEDLISKKYAQTPRGKQLVKEWNRVLLELSRANIDPEAIIKDEVARQQLLQENPKAAEFVERYERLPQDLKDLGNQIVNDLRNKYKALLDTMIEAYPEAEANLREEFVPLNYYLPMVRKGDYWFKYVTKDGEEGKASAESPFLRKKKKEQLRQEGATNFEDFAQSQRAEIRGAPPAAFVQRLKAKINNDPKLSDEAKKLTIENIEEQYLSLFPEQSLRNQEAHRKGIPGYEEDILFAYASTAPKIVSSIANAKYNNKIVNTSDIISKEASNSDSALIRAIGADTIKSLPFYLNPVAKGWAAMPAYLSYVWYIGGNISSAIVNLTQIPLIVLPFLQGEYGFDSSQKALFDAMKLYGAGGFEQNRGFLPDRTSAPFTINEKTGEKTYTGKNAKLFKEGGKYHNLFTRAEETAALRRGIGYEITELQKNLGQEVGSGLKIKSKVEAGIGYVFQNSERINREITLIAAFNLARSKGASETDAIQKAIELTSKVHSHALPEVGPSMFQDGIGKVAFVFKRFAQAQIYLVSKLFNDVFNAKPKTEADKETRAIAAKQLIGVYGYSFLMAGIQGMPLYGGATVLASLLLDDDDEPFEPHTYVNAAVGDLAFRGPLSALLGIDISQRTGFRDLAFREDPARLEKIGASAYMMEVLGGPGYGILRRFTEGVGMIADGDVGRGAERVLPTFLGNALKTVRYNTDGMTNKYGVPIIEGDPSVYESFMQIVGFSNIELAEAYTKANALKGPERKLLARKSKLLLKYYLARQAGDEDGVEDIQRDIDRFNSKAPKGFQLSRKTIQRSMKARDARLKDSVNGVFIGKKYDESLNDIYGIPD